MNADERGWRFRRGKLVKTMTYGAGQLFDHFASPSLICVHLRFLFLWSKAV